jgi:short-subunit dehydrogenase
MSETILVLGANSGIGRALVRQLGAEGARLILAGRSPEQLERTARDLELRFDAQVAVEPFEALDFDSHQAFFQSCTKRFADGLDGVVLCHGVMPEPEELESDFAIARRMIDVNFSSAVSILNRAASYLESRGRGWICAFSSVAGDRGRPSNYTYGSTKAGLSTYLQGLHARLARAGVGCVCVKPGFVDTGLTYGRPGLFLVASPEKVARDAMRGVRRRRSVVYTPWFWAGIMLAIRLLPVPVFRRLPL